MVSTGQPQRIKAMKKTKEKNEPEVILSDHDPFVCRCCIHCIALLSLEHNLTSFQRFVDLTLPKLLFDLFYSEQIDKSSGEAVVLFFANILHSSKQIQAQIMKGADIVQLLLSSRDMLFSPHTISRCLSALLCIARIPDFKRVAARLQRSVPLQQAGLLIEVLSHLDLLMADINANLNMEESERDEHFYQIAALQCSLLSELARASYEYHEQMAKSGIAPWLTRLGGEKGVEALLVFITMAGKDEFSRAMPGYGMVAVVPIPMVNELMGDLNDKVCVELLMGAVFGIAALVGSPTGGDHSCLVDEGLGGGGMASLIYPATRLQLLLSLLRLPQQDVNEAFHSGTVGLRTLQRVIYPNITTEDPGTARGFDGHSEFSRNVIRTVCLLLSHHEMGPRVQQALEPSNVVPTCLFAMKDCEDTYVQVYGFLLVANFSRDRALLYNFLNESAVINELLTTIRRSAPHANAPEATLPVRETLSNVTGPWSSSAVARNRSWAPNPERLRRGAFGYMLAMSALTNFAERVKEKFRGDDGEIPVNPDMKDDGGLVISNRITLNKLTSTCMRELDTIAMEKKLGELTPSEEFIAMLRVLICANNFMARVELEDPGRGGEARGEGSIEFDAHGEKGAFFHLWKSKRTGVDIQSKFSNELWIERTASRLRSLMVSPLTCGVKPVKLERVRSAPLAVSLQGNCLLLRSRNPRPGAGDPGENVNLCAQGWSEGMSQRPVAEVSLEARVKELQARVADVEYQYKQIAEFGSNTSLIRLLGVAARQVAGASSLVAAVVECLTGDWVCEQRTTGGLTFLSPLSIRAPLVAYRISLGCPEWLQPSLMALIANALADPARINQFEEDEPECMLRARSDHLFPMLATSTLEIRQKVLGVLANAAAQDELLEFIVNSGVFRICKGIPGKGWFVEHFALMIELTRMLANLTCRQNTHKAVMTPDTMAFLRDVLRHCAVLFHRAPCSELGQDEDKFDYYEVVFEPEDAPPLGLRIGWELPPQLSKVLPNRSAARVCTELRPGDELVEVNGTDVTELEQGDIEPMFEARPLKLLFRRRPEPSKERGRGALRGWMKGGGALEAVVTRGVREEKQEEGMRVVGNIRIEQVQKVAAYGDPAQYLECFNLAVLVIHNLAVEAKNLELLHSEPRILRVLLEVGCSLQRQVMPADATSPSLRRLIFSTLTCLCQEKAVSGRIFHAMAEYFQNCQKTDSSLHKYIMCGSDEERAEGGRREGGTGVRRGGL
ncbi:Hypothetical protein (Fragment) [Durusdinium trenchii]|uniref:PDZ domain-containing protein n=1 Tax=Durusdinium trenchii TaxID=1381693 RepID=A0ABP0IG05_9DINO